MRWSRATEMGQEVQAALTDALNLGYLSCGVELQVASINTIADLYVDADVFRKAAIDSKDEELANRTFVLQRFMCGTQNLLRMWVHLKQDQAEQGWDALIGAQTEIECGLRFQELEVFRQVAKRLLLLESVLFPPQVFTSPSMVYQSSSCTICEGEYGECDHVAGRLYMGQMCAARRRGNLGIDHQAIVKDPKDKACRVIRFQRDNYMVNKLTLRVEGEANNPNEEHMKMESVCLRVGASGGIYRMKLAPGGKISCVENQTPDAE